MKHHRMPNKTERERHAQCTTWSCAFLFALKRASVSRLAQISLRLGWRVNNLKPRMAPATPCMHSIDWNAYMHVHEYILHEAIGSHAIDSSRRFSWESIRRFSRTRFERQLHGMPAAHAVHTVTYFEQPHVAFVDAVLVLVQNPLPTER